jgi:inward rectifier potassium channel
MVHALMAEKYARLNATDRLPPIRVRGLHIGIFDDAYHRVLVCSWKAFFAGATLIFLGINLVFGILYMLGENSISGARSGSFADSYFFSVQTIATIGYGGLQPGTLYGHVLVTAEALLGIFSTALITGLTFAKFSRPSARVLFAEKGIITLRDGQPYLAFRMANRRNNRIIEAQLRVVLLTVEKTSEGETLRRPHELPLVRDRNALFTLSWLALHRIDEASPFFGWESGRLEEMKKLGYEMYLALSGTDETSSQTLHARYSYTLDDIVPRARYVDVVHLEPDGARIIDYSVFHDIQPQVLSSKHPSDLPPVA